ncbi:MAG: DUF2007 domain-containing protein [Nitrospirae bacterium]|nr:MAG: DUF2007 domain-containing protein [Nitrospirota bacterium]
MKKPEEPAFVKILSTFNPLDIAMIKSLLDPEGIEYFFLGEHFNYVRPLADPAVLMVRREQEEMAREILRDLTITFTVSGPDEPVKE